MDGFVIKCVKCGTEIDFKDNFEAHCNARDTKNETDIYFDTGYECEINKIVCMKCGNTIEL